MGSEHTIRMNKYIHNAIGKEKEKKKKNADFRRFDLHSTLYITYKNAKKNIK